MARLLLILESDAYGIPLQGAKLYVFKHGGTVLNTPYGVPTGIALSGATWDDPDAGSLLSSAGNHLEVVTDDTGQKYVWMDTADVIDVVVTDNNHTAFPLGAPTQVATFNNYLKVILPIPQFTASVIPSAVDFKVTWDGVTAIGTTARPGGTQRSGPNIGNAVNQVLSDNAKVGPAGSENLGSPGVTIQLISLQSDNAAAPIPSTDVIGKVYAASVAGTINNLSPNLSDSTGGGPFTPDFVGRLVYVRLGAAAGSKDYHGIVQTYNNPTSVTMDRNFGTSISGTAKWSVPITLGSHILGQGGGTRNQGNGHPDDGPLVLQCSGGGWQSKALIDFRNAPAWTEPGFGSEIFQVANIALDANKLADYALVGMGVGTGNAAWCSSYTAQGGTVANVGIGNHYDVGGSSDVFHTDFVSSNPNPVVTTTMNGAQALPGGGAPTTITVGSTTSFLPEGYLEITSPAGTQLVHYASKTDSTHFGTCTGGTGTAANGASVKQWAYAFEVNQGDVYVVDDFNMATSARALFINMNTSVSPASTCMIGRGHMGGGGGGGPIITIPWGSQVTIGPGVYVDNIKNSDVGGIWVVPFNSTAVNQLIVMPGTRFNLNDGSAPIVLDGANGGSGTLFQLSGFTNGNSVATSATVNGAQALPPGGGSLLVNDTTGYNNNGWISVATDRGWGSLVKYTSKDLTHFLGCTGGVGTAANGTVCRQSSIFVVAKNSWPASKGIFIDHVNARTCIAVWASDNATMPDGVGQDIILANSGSTGAYMTMPWLPQRAPNAASRPSPDLLGPGSRTADSQINRELWSDGQQWCPVQVGHYQTATNATAAYAPDMSLGDHLLLTQSSAGWTLQAPTKAIAGMDLYLEILRNTAGALGTNFNAIFVLTNGGWTDPTVNGKKRNIHFRFDGTNWIEFSRNNADY